MLEFDTERMEMMKQEEKEDVLSMTEIGNIYIYLSPDLQQER